MASGNPLVRWLNNKLSVPQNNSFSDMELELAYQTFKQLCQSLKGMSPGVREMRVEIPSEQQSLFSELLNLPKLQSTFDFVQDERDPQVWVVSPKAVSSEFMKV